MTITGRGRSRLSELRKYSTSGSLTNQYFISYSSGSGDGVNPNLTNLTSIPQVIVYYIGGITYTDQIYDNGTVITSFSFDGQGYDSPDFVDLPAIKDPNKSNLVSPPKTDNDVFIVRQQLSVFDKNYKLKDVRNLVELTTYAGGKFFNIVNNT